MTKARPLSIAMLWHAGSATNLGLSALTWSDIVLVDRAASMAGREARIDLLLTGPLNTSRLDPLPVEVGMVQIEVQPTRLRAARSCLRLRRLLAEYDVTVDIASGDSFTSMYGTTVLRRQLATKYAAACSSSCLVLAPQTLGPFTWRDKWFAGAVVAQAAVTFCRDEPSAEFARRWSKTKVEVVPDVGFCVPHRHDPAHSPDRVHVGVNPSGLLYSAQPRDRYFVPGYRDLLHALLAALTARSDVQVHLVPHVVSLTKATSGDTPDEDLGLCRDLLTHYPSCVLPNAFVTAGSAKNYIAALDVLVASRLHASIAAAGAGVPVVSIAYSRKFLDTLQTVGYKPPLLRPSLVGTQASVNEFMSLLLKLETLRAQVSSVADTAQRGLARYVAALAETFGSSER